MTPITIAKVKWAQKWTLKSGQTCSSLISSFQRNPHARMQQSLLIYHQNQRVLPGGLIVCVWEMQPAPLLISRYATILTTEIEPLEFT